MASPVPGKAGAGATTMEQPSDSASALRHRASALRHRRRGVLIMAGLLAVGVIGTVVLHATGWDLAWPRHFFTPGGANGGWSRGEQAPWGILYEHGDIPAFLLVAAALALLAAAVLDQGQRRWRRPCGVVILTVVIGPGLLVNGILKPYWGRPRPAETTPFGGPYDYRPPWQPGTPQRGCSFTSGHSALAFSLTSVASFASAHPTLGAATVAGGVAYGVMMGTARVAQGGHFPSDVLWSGVLVLLIQTALHYLVFRIPESSCGSRRPPRLQRRTIRLLITVFLVLPSTVIVLAHPIHERRRHSLDEVAAGASEIVLSGHAGHEVARMETADGRVPVVLTVTRGLGPIWADLTEDLEIREVDGTVHVHHRVAPSRSLYWWTTRVAFEPLPPIPK